MNKIKHKNIPIFIPHLGCPHDCVFCNQKKISGHTSFDISKVKEEIEQALLTVGKEEKAEIAFFGGSFTGIDRNLMISLLDIAEGYVKEGRVIGIRMSTRPDYIDEEILDILKRYTVSAIELGLQSFDERVLLASERGHTVSQSKKACALIKEYGFPLVGQMMIGLPSASRESEINTAKEILSLGCIAARVYPTVIFASTKLARMTKEGSYIPLTEEEAIMRTADVLEILTDGGVTLLRVGLCSNEDIRNPDEVLGGATHPAMGELCIGELYYRKIRKEISFFLIENPEEKFPILTLLVPRGSVSKAVGQNKRNSLRLYKEFCKDGRIGKIKFAEDANIKDLGVKIKTTD